MLGDGEALLSLTATTFTQLIDLYGAADKDPVPPGMADATVRVELATTIDASGAIVTNGQRTNVVTRDDEGDRLLTVTDATGELAFNPPALIVPAELDVGKEWSSSGTAGTLEYTVEGKVLERTKTDRFDDCLRFEVSSAVGESTSRSQNVACAGIGIVERDDLDEDGALFQHIDVLTSGTTQFTDDGLPTPPAAVPSPPAPDGELSLGRVGKGTPTGSISPPTFPAQFVPSDPPSILVASERGDLVALAADAPDVVQWRFHPGGSMYGAPGLDPKTGWLYAGATDKRLYALDGRGYFLWSVEADDNIATRPAVARGIVVYASEAGTAFGIDAANGEQRWERDLGAGSVAWPAVVDDTVVFGTDDGTIRAVDIDDGSGRWSHTADGSVEAAITTDSAGTAYVVDSGGGVRAIDATTGDVLWHVQENDSFRSAAVATNGLVVFVGESGAIYAVDAETGDAAWQSTGDFVGPVAETGGAIVVVPRADSSTRSPRTAASSASWRPRARARPATRRPTTGSGSPVPPARRGRSTRARSCAGSARGRAASRHCKPDGSTRSPSRRSRGRASPRRWASSRTKPCSWTLAVPCTSSTRRPAIPSASATTRTARSRPAPRRWSTAARCS